MRVRERGFVGPRINGKEQLILMNEVAIFEMHVKKFAGHLGFHRDGVASDVADAGHLHRHGPLRDFGHHDGNGRRAGRRPSLLRRTPGGRKKQEEKRRPESEFAARETNRSGAVDSNVLHSDLGYAKNMPFCSRPSTEIRLRAGSGVSDSNRKPGCSTDHLIVAPVLKNGPLKVCVLL